MYPSCLSPILQANKALRTLCLAHIDYASTDALDVGYEVESPDADNMILDAIVGIMDPLRGDVKEAVATAQRAGVMVSFARRAGEVALALPVFRSGMCLFLLRKKSVAAPVVSVVYMHLCRHQFVVSVVWALFDYRTNDGRFCIELLVAVDKSHRLVCL